MSKGDIDVWGGGEICEMNKNIGCEIVILLLWFSIIYISNIKFTFDFYLKFKNVVLQNTSIGIFSMQLK